MRRDGESVGSSERDERVTMREWFEHIEEAIESATANVKLFDKALAGMQGSYVELLTIVALGLLAVLPIFAPRRGRQLFRHLNQIVGIAIFIFVVYTCLGVFGMIRNFHRGLNEIGRENIVALYYCAVPVTVLVMLLVCLIWNMGSMDRRLRRLRWVSFELNVCPLRASSSWRMRASTGPRSS